MIFDLITIPKLNDFQNKCSALAVLTNIAMPSLTDCMFSRHQPFTGRPFEMIQYFVSAFCIAQHYSNGKFHNVLIETLLVQQSSRLFSCPPEICIALFSITVFRHALILLPHRHQLSRLTSKSHPKTNKHLFVTDFRLTLQFCIIALNLPIFQNKMHSTKTFILDKYFLFML